MKGLIIIFIMLIVVTTVSIVLGNFILKYIEHLPKDKEKTNNYDNDEFDYGHHCCKSALDVCADCEYWRGKGCGECPYNILHK